MVAFQLDPSKQQQLMRLAASEGQDVAELARRIIEDYLDFVATGDDTPEAAAEASVAMLREVMTEEAWPDDEGPA